MFLAIEVLMTELQHNVIHIKVNKELLYHLILLFLHYKNENQRLSSLILTVNSSKM